MLVKFVMPARKCLLLLLLLFDFQDFFCPWDAQLICTLASIHLLIHGKMQLSLELVVVFSLLGIVSLAVNMPYLYFFVDSFQEYLPNSIPMIHNHLLQNKHKGDVPMSQCNLPPAHFSAWPCREQNWLCVLALSTSQLMLRPEVIWRPDSFSGLVM